MAKVTKANYAAKLKAAILNAAITGKLTGGTTGWKTVKLGEVCDYGKCTSILSSEIKDDVWSLDLEDIEKDSGKLLLRVRFGERRAKGTRHIFKKGQLLYSKLRTYLNKVLVADEDGVCTTEIIPLDFGGKVLPEYARIVLMSQMVLDYTASCCYGVKMPRLGTHDGRMMPFPLPPLGVQREIVGKVEELMGFVEVVQEGAAKIRELREKARAKILDLAIHGKLVAQDPAEPPAAVGASVTTPPYALPPNWKWVKLGEVCDLISGRDLMPSQYNGNQQGIPYITGASNIEDGNVLINRWTQFPVVIAKYGDLLLTCKGTVGKLAFLKEEQVHIARQIMALREKRDVSLEYIRIVIEVNVEALKAQAKSMIPGIDRKAMLEMEIPLPPFGEQKRIVEKVEAMMKVLEGLVAAI